MTAHDALDGRQPESAARRLGREERIEDARQGLGVHAHAVVSHFQPDVVAGGEAEHAGLVCRGGLADPQGSRAGRHPDATFAGADGVRGVGQQVHHHLPQLRRIAGHHRQVPREVEGHADVLRDDRSEQFVDFLGERFELHRQHDEPAAPGVGEHLRRELAGAQRRTFDALDMGPPRGAGRQIGERETGFPEHADQQVVEVVGDAARQHAEALEPLRLLDSLVEQPALPLGPLPLDHLVPEGNRPLVHQALQVLLMQSEPADAPPHEADDREPEDGQRQRQEPARLVDLRGHLKGQGAHGAGGRALARAGTHLEVVVPGRKVGERRHVRVARAHPALVETIVEADQAVLVLHRAPAPQPRRTERDVDVARRQRRRQDVQRHRPLVDLHRVDVDGRRGGGVGDLGRIEDHHPVHGREPEASVVREPAEGLVAVGAIAAGHPVCPAVLRHRQQAPAARQAGMHVGHAHDRQPLRACQPEPADVVLHHVEDDVIGQPVARGDGGDPALAQPEEPGAVGTDPQRSLAVVMQRGDEGVAQSLAVAPADDAAVGLDALQTAAVRADPGALGHRVDDPDFRAAQALGRADAGDGPVLVAHDAVTPEPHDTPRDVDHPQGRSDDLGAESRRDPPLLEQEGAAPVGADPDARPVASRHRRDGIAREAVGRRVHPQCAVPQGDQAAAVGADPPLPGLGPLVDRGHGERRQSRPGVQQFARGWCQAVQPARERADPQRAIAIFGQRHEVVAAQPLGATEGLETHAVVPDQPASVRRQPDVAAPVHEDLQHALRRQALPWPERREPAGIDARHATRAGHPHRTVGRLGHRCGHHAGQPVVDRVPTDLRAVEPDHPVAGRGEPHRAIPGLEHAVDVLVPQVRRQRRRLPAAAIEHAGTAGGGQPHAPAPVPVQARDDRVGHALGGPIADDIAPGHAQHPRPIGADPERTVGLRQHGGEPQVAHVERTDAADGREPCAVEAGESLAGRNPQVTALVLGHARDRVLRQPVLDAPLIDDQARGRLGGDDRARGVPQAQHQQTGSDRRGHPQRATRETRSS